MMYPQSTPGVYLPHGYLPVETDILCGRGKTYVSHPGNRTFMGVIRSNLKAYTARPTRIEKSAVVATVLNNLMDSGMRFLKFDKSYNGFVEISGERAHEKVGHAIRDLLKQQKKKKTLAAATKGARKDSEKKPQENESSCKIAVEPTETKRIDEQGITSTRQSATNIFENDDDQKVMPLHHKVDEKEQGFLPPLPLITEAAAAATNNTKREDPGHTRIDEILFQFSDHFVSSGSLGGVEEELGKIQVNFQQDHFSVFDEGNIFAKDNLLTHTPVKEHLPDSSPLPLDSTTHFESQDLETLSDVLSSLDEL